MVSKKTLGGIIAGSAVAFGGILYYTITSLTSQSGALNCVASNPACQSVVTELSISHIAVGLISALFSLGAYFLFFHNDTQEQVLALHTQQRRREEQLSLLTKVMTQGERAVLDAVLHEEGILQSTLMYRTNLTAGRISQIISEFEHNGLVRRKPEGKSFRVYPTF